MRRKLNVKNHFAALAASALLLSTVAASVGWAQNRPSRAPKKPVGRENPEIRTPVDPRVPILVSPPVISSPTVSSGVDIEKPLVVSGTGMSGAHLRITVSGEWKTQVANRDRPIKTALGNSITYVDSRGNWQAESIRLRIPEQAKDIKIQISAVQTVSGRASSPTVVTVRPLLKVMPLTPPPVQATLAPSLIVNTPKDGGKVAAKDKNLILEGTAIGGPAVNIQLTMDVSYDRGNFFTGGKQSFKKQIHRRVDNTPVKNGRWSSSINIDPGKIDGTITKISYEIFVSLQGQGISKRILLTR